MAIYNGPMASKMRGKVGEIVAAKTVGGQTALRAYQPTVKNPNTKRQQVSRAKMAAASALAAGLSELISIGYTAATKGLKMYPRNLFMRCALDMDNQIVYYEDEEVKIGNSTLLASKACGFSTIPVFATVTPGSGQSFAVSLSNAEDFVLTDGEKLGVVLALIDKDNAEVMVVKGAAGGVVAMPEPPAGRFTNASLYAFVKAVPVSGNEVPTEEWPWKYPSKTSAAVALV